MKKRLFIYFFFFLTACNAEKKQFLTDKNMVILEQKVSADRKHKIISYHFDLGAFDYSRMYWAIIPTNLDKNKPLNDYILPDGYKAVDWNAKDEAMVEKWTPYYYKNEEVKLQSGDEFNGVMVELK
jgi:hypothetical protein